MLQGNWESLSRHVQTVQLIQPDHFPFQHLRDLPIPLVLLRILPYVRSLPARRPEDVVTAPDPPNARWHRQQANLLRGL